MARPQKDADSKRVRLYVSVLPYTRDLLQMSTDRKNEKDGSNLTIAQTAAKLLDNFAKGLFVRKAQKDVSAKCMETEEDTDEEAPPKESPTVEQSTDGPPSSNFNDYMSQEEYDELDRLNGKGWDTLVDAQRIGELRMEIAHLKYKGSDTAEVEQALKKEMDQVARVRAGTHKPPEGTPWTQDFSGLDVEEPPSGWGVYIPEFGYGMIDWGWWKSENFPEPKDAKDVKRLLDERKRLHFSKEDRKVTDLRKPGSKIFLDQKK